MRRTPHAILLTCIFLLCSACQGSGAPPSASSPSGPLLEQIAPSWQTHTDPVTLTLASDHHFSGTDSGYPQWGEDPVSRQISDLTGVKIELQIGADGWAALAAGSHGTAGDADEQTQSSYVDLLQAAGSVPDLIYISGGADIQRLSDSAYSQPLDVLAAEYCPEFWDSLDPLEILNNQQEDGHVYAFRKGYITDSVYDDPTMPIEVPRSLSLRQDILDKLGASLPTSIEALESLLYPAAAPGSAPIARWFRCAAASSGGRPASAVPGAAAAGRGAAELLHMTQPAVTRTIQEIEQYYGVRLFERINRRLYVTESGRELYAHALHIVDTFDAMEKGMRNWDEFGVLSTSTIDFNRLQKISKY